MSRCLCTCLAQHVWGNGNVRPDKGVHSEEDHPEHHAAPNGQMRELQSDREIERERSINLGEEKQNKIKSVMVIPRLNIDLIQTGTTPLPTGMSAHQPDSLSLSLCNETLCEFFRESAAFNELDCVDS